MKTQTRLTKWEFIESVMKQEKVGFSTAYFWWTIYNREESLTYQI